MSHPEIRLDPSEGWTFVEVHSKDQPDVFNATFICWVSYDHKKL
jgi:hypothetical protein